MTQVYGFSLLFVVERQSSWGSNDGYYRVRMNHLSSDALAVINGGANTVRYEGTSSGISLIVVETLVNPND